LKEALQKQHVKVEELKLLVDELKVFQITFISSHFCCLFVSFFHSFILSFTLSFSLLSTYGFQEENARLTKKLEEAKQKNESVAALKEKLKDYETNLTLRTKATEEKNVLLSTTLFCFILP
jgi:hypothetical protein